MLADGIFYVTFLFQFCSIFTPNQIQGIVIAASVYANHKGAFSANEGLLAAIKAMAAPIVPSIIAWSVGLLGANFATKNPAPMV
jgi:hypothetical protein